MNNDVVRVPVGDLETNCWLYAPEEGPLVNGRRPCVVIDPGGGEEAIVSRLLGLGWVPVYIFLTHGHFDHVAALPGLLGAFGRDIPAPRPQIGIHRGDGAFLGKDALLRHRESFAAAGGDPAYIDALFDSLPPADVLFEEGERAGPFRVLHLPGHTRGSAGFFDEGRGVLFSGDTLFRGTWGRTDLPGGNWEEMRGSLKRLLGMEGGIAVYPGHGESTTIGREAGSLADEIFVR